MVSSKPKSFSFLLVFMQMLLFISLHGQPQAIPSSYDSQPIYKIVEESPRFNNRDCEQNESSSDRQHCSKFAFKKYVKEHLRYPQDAKAQNISGIVLLEIIVEPDGRIKFSRILRDIGGGCAQEAIRLVNQMPKWVPGKLKGRPVRVKTPLTVKFELS